MPTEIEDENRFASDVRFALRDIPVVRSREERASEQWRDYIASKIVAHLKLANWVIRRGKPLEDWPGKKRVP